MPKGYVIITEAIQDPMAMRAYSAAAGATLAEHGARILVAGNDLEVVEGEWPGTKIVIVEFDSVEQAREWYRSPGYQAAAAIRQAAAHCNAVIAEGFVPRPTSA